MSDAEPEIGPPQAAGAETADAYPDEVEVLELDGRRIVLVGTAHVSQESVDIVSRVIERERPDTVCIELDQRRFEALAQGKRWESLDLREVVRKRQLTTLLLNLFLASYQKRLGGKLGVVPGSELLAAVELAKARGLPVELCDRDVRVTLRRAWAALPTRKKAMLLSGVLASAGETPDISEEDLRRLRRKDVLSDLMQELGQAMPELKRTLIDERDSYLAAKISAAAGRTLVAVVGAGHLAGMSAALRERRSVDLAELDRIPPVSSRYKVIGWAVSFAIVASIAYLGVGRRVGGGGGPPRVWGRGFAVARDNAVIWGLAHAIPSAIGGLIALGHPLTIVAAFLSAPFTALSPLIGVGYVAAAVQVYFAPPRVSELQAVGDDMAIAGRWWSNRMLRVFLVFILTSVGGALGTWVGGAKILANLLK
jgi:pheromone shutdown-related protein TraB